jgi:hypothetical protein
MNGDPDRFRRPIVEALAKRAAYRCSNPGCAAITSGPAEDETRSITVGEAAHIYGARPGAARYDPLMGSAERSAITNAIWLCRNCHKMVDADPDHFVPALLFEWRQTHERQISEKLGKAEDRLRQKIVDRELEKFQNESYLARQIVIDKPDAWEHRLTAELLRSKLEPLLSRWHALKGGLYVRPIVYVREDTALEWLLSRATEVINLGLASFGILGPELEAAWGPLGEPGSSAAILQACTLFEEDCQQLLAWEETVRFTMLPARLEEGRQALVGLGGQLLDQFGSLPTETAKALAAGRGSEPHRIKVDLPEGLKARVDETMRLILRASVDRR